MVEVLLAELTRPAGRKAGADTNVPVYSVTKHAGFVRSLEYFKKQVFSRDIQGYKLVEPGDFAYATIHLDEGSIGIAPERALISPMYTVFAIDESRVDPAYLVRYLRSPRALAHYPQLGRGAVHRRKAISLQALGSLNVPLPLLDEQRRIAAILDHADALRAQRHQVLAHLDALTQSIFRDMFGDVRTNERGWTAATVDDVAERVTDGEHKTPRRSDFGVPLLSARNVRDGWIDFDKTDFVDEEEFATLSRRIEPRSGDVLISCSGTIGRVAQVGERARFAMVRSAALVRPDASVHPTFLERALASPTLKATMVNQANSSAQANLFQNQIKRLPMVVPPLDLQNEFAGLVDAVNTERAAVVAARAAADELFASFQARAFRGEL